MRWTATSKHWDGDDDTYGLMTMDGRADAGVPRQAALRPARALWRLGRVSPQPAPSDPTSMPSSPGTTRGAAAPCSSIRRRAAYADRASRLGRRARGLCTDLLRLDAGTGDRVVREPFDGRSASTATASPSSPLRRRVE